MKKVTLMFFIVVSVLFSSCNKDELAKSIEIKGRVVNFATGTPEQASIEVWVGGYPGSKGTTNFGSVGTNSDGTFSFKSKPQFNGNDYTLRLFSYSTNSYIDINCSVKSGNTVNVGDIKTGQYTFYSKVTINSVSGSAIDFLYPVNYHFNAGKDTTFMTSEYYSDYEGYATAAYSISYKVYPSGIEKDTALWVPITLPPDTLSVTINY